jgi:dTDP-4-dehydrorhamnose 3,5-epimerase
VRFVETPLAGAWVLEPDLVHDERGWFARTFDAQELAAHGMEPAIAQANTSFNPRRDTLRGMHFQRDPHGEPKLVRCVRGAIFDVAVDLRPGSPTHRAWHAVELRAGDARGLYIPAGMAHGFQTLEDDTEVHYLMGARYAPESASGVRWDDPAFAIEWPRPAGERIISERDRGYPDYSP